MKESLFFCRKNCIYGNLDIKNFIRNIVDKKISIRLRLT